MPWRLFLLMPLACAAMAQVATHQVHEITVAGPPPDGNPLQVERTVEVRCGAGEAIQAPVFWDGGTVWKARFRAPKQGRCRWDSGETRVEPYRGSNVLYSKGPIAVAKSRTHFSHASGDPWFFLADTAWNGALWSTDSEWQKYIAARTAQRFTAVQFVMTQWRAGRKDELDQVAFTTEGGLKINPAFFQRMDKKFKALNDAGLVAVPVLLWALTSKDNESPGVVLSAEDASRLARYMVKRYGAYHVLWFLGGDGDYREDKAERWKSIGRAVFPQNEKRSPVTLHPRGGQDPWPAFTQEYWVDFFTFQSGHGGDARKWRWNATEGGAKAWKYRPPRPVIDAEPNYEAHRSYQGKIVDAYDVRRAAYYSLLGAPPAGITYGAHGVWYWSRKPEPPLDHERSGIAEPWEKCLDYEGARNMTTLRAIFEDMEWWRLRPDRSVIDTDEVDSNFSNYIAAAKSDNGRFALLYYPAGVKAVTRTGDWKKVTWIDPSTGAKASSKTLAADPPGGKKDWLLYLTR